MMTEFDSRRARLAAEASQERAPWHAVARTVVQVLVSLAVIVPVAVPIIIEELGDYLPDAWVAWLLGAVAVIVAVTGAVTRIMAVPAVNDFLRRWLPGLAPERKQ